MTQPHTQPTQPHTQLWFEHLWWGGKIYDSALVTVDAAGRVAGITENTPLPPHLAATQRFTGLALPGANNAHSHAFHRLLRGRTHAGGGTFWTWRTVMYKAAAQLTPDNYYTLATAVFAEMLTAGYTSVAEFHYVHHQPNSTPYPDHQMELALARAAQRVGIRLLLLDTCYLRGGLGTELSPEQARFGDGSIGGFMDRHADLGRVLAATPTTLGAAIHSVRAVAREDLPAFADLPGPLHVHLSEQPAENQACLDMYGLTPTQLLAQAGVLTDRLAAVHATHVTPQDIDLLGQARAAVVMCPTTEADLADGIGPARQLADAGAVIALGSDQHVALDPLLEVRALEAGERLGSGARGRFTPTELVTALTGGGAYAMGLPWPTQSQPTQLAQTGNHTQQLPWADFCVVDTGSVRTVGSVGEQALLAGTASDVTYVIVAGQVRAQAGRHMTLGAPAELYAQALREFDFGS